MVYLKNCYGMSINWYIQAVTITFSSDFSLKLLTSENKRRPIFRLIFSILVGTTRFELATPRPPDVCATGLRYVPNSHSFVEWGANIGLKEIFKLYCIKFSTTA